jgi:hypothetical protein
MMTITSPRSRSIESTRCRVGGVYVTASSGAVVATAVAIGTSEVREGWGANRYCKVPGMTAPDGTSVGRTVLIQRLHSSS